jgi:O-antigen/teichoic acid export membrane protein
VVKSSRFGLIALAPIVGMILLAAGPFMNLWLGEEFFRNSTPVLQLLAVGVLFNFLAQIPASALQALGRPDLTAKLNIIELPVYLVALFLLLPTMGIVGAALAWTLRVAVDCILHYALAHRLFPEKPADLPGRTGLLFMTGGILLAALFGLSYLDNLLLALGFAAALLAASGTLVWRLVLDRFEKQLIRDLARGRFGGDETRV